MGKSRTGGVKPAVSKPSVSRTAGRGARAAAAKSAAKPAAPKAAPAKRAFAKPAEKKASMSKQAAPKRASAKADGKAKTARKGWKPSFKGLKLHPGLIIGGSKKGLEGAGYKMKPVGGKGKGRAYLGSKANGERRLFVDRAFGGYRRLAKRFGLSGKGDIDHVVAKRRTPLLSMLSSSKKSANRSAGSVERKAGKAPLTDGVHVADPSQILKIRGFNQEKKSDPLRTKFGGYAGDAAKALQAKASAAAKPTASKSAAAKPVIRSRQSK